MKTSEGQTVPTEFTLWWSWLWRYADGH